MRTILILGVIVTLGACDGAGTSGSDTGRAAQPIAAATAPRCSGAAALAAGHAITVEDDGDGQTVLVRADGVPLCRDTLAAVTASGVLDNRPVSSGPEHPASSDPMPARGDGDDKNGSGSGGGTGGKGTNTGGTGGTGGGAGGQGGTTTNGDGNSDPMPADDTRRT